MNLHPLNHKNVQWFTPLMPAYLARQMKESAAPMGVGVVVDGVACGVAVVVVADEMVHLSYLMVAPDYRRQGVATQMVDFLCRLSGQTLLPLVGFFSVEDHREGLYHFFLERRDFDMNEDGALDTHYTLPVASLTNLPQPKENSSIAQNFHNLSVNLREDFYDAMDALGCDFLRQYEEQPQLGIPTLNHCYVDDKGVAAAVFYEPYGEGDLRLAVCYGREDALQEQVLLVVDSLSRLASSPYREATLHLSPITTAEQWIVEKLPQWKALGTTYMVGLDLEQWEE